MWYEHSPVILDVAQLIIFVGICWEEDYSWNLQLWGFDDTGDKWNNTYQEQN